MNRRSFLSRSLLSAASFGVGTALPFGRNRFELFRSADAAGLPTPYPVLMIMCIGGIDPAMHLVATPNGSVGGVTLVNRLPGTSSFKKTRTGIDYVSSVVTPVGKTDFEPHLNDVALLRALRLEGDHAAQSSIWFGYRIGASSVKTGPGTTRFGRAPWTNQLAAQFRKRGLIVPKPCSIAYKQEAAFKTEPYRDFLSWGNQSPDPATQADRILSLASYFKAISTVGLPPPARQAPSYDLINILDRSVPADSQPDYAERFAAANNTASQVLRTVLAGGPIWPPAPETLTALGLTASNLNPDLTSDAQYEHMFALAFQALSRNVAHVVAFKTEGDRDSFWDTHSGNVTRQTRNGNHLWPTLGKLIALMKITPSPIVNGKSLFDTTNIWVQSEMGRSPNAQMRDKDAKGNPVPPYLTDGNEHWSHGSATFMGGRFKRGIAIGGFTPTWEAKPINPATGGEAGGMVLNMNNAIATVMKAAGGDPSEFTNAAPIDALLDMSL